MGWQDGWDESGTINNTTSTSGMLVITDPTGPTTDFEIAAGAPPGINLWTGLGMNIGSDIVSSGTYNAAQVKADLAFLKAAGFTHLRVNLPDYGNATGITNMQTLAVAAITAGFYVSYGITITETFNNTTLTGVYQTAMLAQAAWAQAHGVQEFQVGNELENYEDGSTVTDATVRAWVRAQSSAVKSAGFTGKVSYSVGQGSSSKSAGWVTSAGSGLGGLDYLAINVYGDDQLDTTGGFKTYITALVAAYSSATIYVSEFNIIYTWTSPYMTLSATEIVTQVSDRLNKVIASGVPRGLYYDWRSASDLFAVKTAAGPLAAWWWPLSGQWPTLEPAPPVVSNFSTQGPLVNASGTLAANVMYVAQITVPVACKITGIAFYVAANATGNGTVALYNAAGALIASSGAVALAGTYQAQGIPFSSGYPNYAYAVVGAGVYYAAFIPSSAAAAFGVQNTTGPSGGVSASSPPSTITPPVGVGGAFIPQLVTY